MRRRSHSANLLVAGPLAALACLAVAALACPLASGASLRLHAGPGTSAGSARAEAARVARYWTPARMHSARPLETLGRRRRAAKASFAPIPDASVPPYAVNGRIFIRQGRQRSYCSGTAIDSPTRRLVLTAGHCVNSGPRGRRGSSVWSRFLQFVPAYSDGLAPFGAFVARRGAVYAPRQWVRWGNPTYDIGALLTLPNADGQNVADAVGGGAAIVTNRSRRQEFQTFGYPGKTRRLQGCDSPYVGDDSRTYRLPGRPTMAIRCHWTPGASGGGWLIEAGAAINGLTSYGRRRDRAHTYSPYFDRSNVGRLVAGL
ncbi:MAG: hypothetical protein FVQ78_03270 [Solirubrobacterales bacterium]|nr:hypothetical protein [Solirubrobacterales bacterium]